MPMDENIKHGWAVGTRDEVERRTRVRKKQSYSSYSEVKSQGGRTVTTFKEEKREYSEEVFNPSNNRIKDNTVMSDFDLKENAWRRRRLHGEGPTMQADVINAYNAYQAVQAGDTVSTSVHMALPQLVKTEQEELESSNASEVPDLCHDTVGAGADEDIRVCASEPEVTEQPSCVEKEDVPEVTEPPPYGNKDCVPEPKVTEPPPYSPPEPQEFAYVGLVNQAMTCYLNSLVQTLYMTPEFRNALYRWEADNKEDAVKNLPYHLQKLFLQLQVSKKPAIGTTELTTSFGWDSSEAWQQHDVQELCRVMFDALEQRFTNTDQADLISRLYEGKLKDYVRCLECGYESAREDTFLDVPLVVRPFGSNQTFGSVGEALHAFVAPEILDGSNQYFCERCDRKCNAHKGLKFLKFPYLLTLQLKRFDFDPNTLHRIKLNDKVTFPEVLNLNEFVETENELTRQEKLDDTDMTDSGSGFDDDPAFKASSTVSSDDVGDMVDVDEGIDLVSNGNHEVPAYDKPSDEKAPGPYEYELFSIMVHSGSANGGHYFAHIKSFSDGQWYCFNDVQVTKITYDDIKRTYGGGSARGNYSSAYTSSANAYMLMYRQIDKHRNAKPMQPVDFPQHLKKVLESVEEMEKKEQEKLDLEKAMCKFKLFCNHPVDKELVERKLVVHKDNTLADVRGTAYELLGLNGVVPYDCCRLVKYDSYFDSIEISLEEAEDLKVSEILVLAKVMESKASPKFDILLEIRNPDEEFVSYKPGGTTIKVYTMDLEEQELSDPVTIRSNLTSTVDELKQQIAKKLRLPSSNMRLVLKKYDRELLLLSCPEKKLEHEGFYRTDKVFVEYQDSEDGLIPFLESKLYLLLTRHDHTLSIYFILPNLDRDAMAKQLNLNGVDAEVMRLRIANAKGAGVTMSPVSSGYQGSKTMNSDHSENSSLSSLTDSERTLVGDEMSPRNNSPVLDSNDEVKWDDVRGESVYSGCVNSKPREPVESEECVYWDDLPSANEVKPQDAKSYVYFKVEAFQGTVPEAVLHAYVDKRMTQADLKKQLEPFVGATANYFKLYRVFSNNQEFECTKMTDNLMHWNEDCKIGCKVKVRLGRSLLKGEYRVKVYQLLVNNYSPEVSSYVAEVVFCRGMTVLQAKQVVVDAWEGTKIPLNRVRLRKKNWKNPGTIFFDSQKFEDDIPILDNWEVFVELLSEEERVTNPLQLSIYLRIWHPATLQLTPLMEVVLNEQLNDSLQAIPEVLYKFSEASGIRQENLEIAKGQGTFPCEMNPLTMQTEMYWHHSSTNCLTGGPWYISTESGSVVVCRDKTEVPKKLSENEKKEFLAKETPGVTKSSAKTVFLPQKEKALKIYTDSPPASALRNHTDSPTASASHTFVPATSVE